MTSDEAQPTPADEANAAFIVRAVNSHDALLAAAKDAQAHIVELEEAWQRGCINESDGQGGTRSNRNTAVRINLHRAIAAAEAGE